MALILPPRVLETTTTTGTGTLTLAGAVTGWQSFAAVGDTNTCYYVLWAVDANGVPTGAWEEGLGTYTASGTTLARTTVYNSSNAGAAVDLAAGTKYVAVARPSEGTGVFLQPGGTAGTDEVQVSHDGTDGRVESKDGKLRLFANGDSRSYAANGGFVGAAFTTDNGAGTNSFQVTSDSNVKIASNRQITFDSTTSISGAQDTGLSRAAAGVVRVTDSSTGGGSLEFVEVTAPAAGDANTARLYAEDDGAGKTRLVVKWSDGTTAVLATQA